MAGSDGDHLGIATDWLDAVYEDSQRVSPLRGDNAAAQKIINLQRELEEEMAASAKLQKQVKDLEVELTLARQELRYQKAPSNAELWQQVIAQRELIKELEDRCARLNREAKRAQDKCRGQEEALVDFRYFENSPSPSAHSPISRISMKSLPDSAEQMRLRDELKKLETQLAEKDAYIKEFDVVELKRLRDDMKRLQTLLADREAYIKEFKEELFEGAELLAKANEENEELKEKNRQLEEEVRTSMVDNSKAVAINLKLHKRIDRLDGRLQETLNELEVEIERNFSLKQKLHNMESEHRTDVTRLESQLQQAVKGLESLSDRQQSKTSMRAGLSHLLSKLRPGSKPTRSQSHGTPMWNRADQQPKYSGKQRH